MIFYIIFADRLLNMIKLKLTSIGTIPGAYIQSINRRETSSILWETLKTRKRPCRLLKIIFIDKTIENNNCNNITS